MSHTSQLVPHSHDHAQRPGFLSQFSWAEDWNPITVCESWAIETHSHPLAARRQVFGTRPQTPPFALLFTHLLLQSYILLGLQLGLAIMCFYATLELNKMHKFHHSVRLRLVHVPAHCLTTHAHSPPSSTDFALAIDCPHL